MERQAIRSAVTCLFVAALTASMTAGCKWLGRNAQKDAGSRAVVATDDTSPATDPDLKSALAELEKANAGLFDACDTSKNGYLSGAEIATCSAAGSDTDKDGRVTRAEFLAARGSPPPTTTGATTSKTAVATTTPKPTTTAPAATATTTEEQPARGAGATASVAGYYACFGIVSSRLQSLGQFTLDANGGYHLDQPKEGDFTYDPATHTVTWLNGLYARKFRAGKLHNKQISMTTTDGFYQWDCDKS